MNIGFIGTGNMGSSLSKAVAKSIGGKNIYLCDHTEEKAAKVADSFGGIVETSKNIWELCDYVFFAVKPQVLKQTIDDITSKTERNNPPVVISMAAGISLEKLSSYFGTTKQTPIIRIMPNTPTRVGKGVTLYCHNEYVNEKNLSLFLDMMKESGELSQIKEDLIDVGTALTGCGPAFVYMFIESLADGAVKCGLSRQNAIKYAAETLIGASEMVLKTGEHPDKLKDDVCSPKGGTIEGVHALEEKAFRSAVSESVIVSFNRIKEISK